MKFATTHHQGKDQPVLIQGEQAWLVHDLIPSFTGDLAQLIVDYDQLKGQLMPAGSGLPLAELRLVAPLQSLPRNIICVGKNYHAHAREFSESGFDSSTQAGEHSPGQPGHLKSKTAADIKTGTTNGYRH